MISVTSIFLLRIIYPFSKTILNKNIENSYLNSLNTNSIIYFYLFLSLLINLIFSQKRESINILCLILFLFNLLIFIFSIIKIN